MYPHWYSIILHQKNFASASYFNFFNNFSCNFFGRSASPRLEWNTGIYTNSAYPGNVLLHKVSCLDQSTIASWTESFWRGFLGFAYVTSVSTAKTFPVACSFALKGRRTSGFGSQKVQSRWKWPWWNFGLLQETLRLLSSSQFADSLVVSFMAAARGISFGLFTMLHICGAVVRLSCLSSHIDEVSQVSGKLELLF